MKEQFLSAIKYTALAKYLNLFFSLATGGILARLLSPVEYGVVAIVTVFLTFFSMFSDFGISSGIVQYRELSTRQIQAIVTLTFFLALVLALLFYGTSFFVAEFYVNPSYIEIGLYSSISLFFATNQVVFNGIFRRDKRFKEIAIIEISVNVLSGVVAVLLALFGFGYWSLIYRSVLSSILSFSLFFWRAKLPIKLSFDFQGISEMLKYSSFNFLFNFVNYFARNLDNILVGKYLGISALAFYEKAYTLMRMPLDNLTVVITPTLHPVLSSSNVNSDEIFNVHKKLIELMTFLGVPISIFLFFSAESIVLLLFGSQWVETISPFKWLSLSVWVQMILSSTGAFFQVKNQTKWLFVTGFCSAVTLVLAILIGIYHSSIEVLSLFLAFSFYFNLFQSFFFISRYVFQKKYFYFLEVINKYIFSGCLLFIFMFYSQFYLSENLFFSLVSNLVIVSVCWFITDIFYFKKGTIYLEGLKKVSKK